MFPTYFSTKIPDKRLISGNLCGIPKTTMYRLEPNWRSGENAKTFNWGQKYRENHFLLFYD